MKGRSERTIILSVETGSCIHFTSSHCALPLFRCISCHQEDKHSEKKLLPFVNLLSSRICMEDLGINDLERSCFMCLLSTAGI